MNIVLRDNGLGEEELVPWELLLLFLRNNIVVGPYKADLSAYGGGQVLNIDTKKMQVTYVGHRGFAPDGSTIYYIATDASVRKVADALGVTFVNKTGAALLSGA